MALTSPGVQVTVIDESFYTPAEPGTTPLIVVATGQNKNNAAGTATAAGTTQANAGKAFKVTSQKELVDTFGIPFFEKTASGSPIHGGERNEYGLLAAYSYLGSSASAFIVRANVDLDQLAPQADAPGANPTDGAWWFDTQATAWGIQEWNGATATAGGQKFVTKTPIVLSDDDSSKLDGNVPKSSVGSIGDYAVVALSSDPVAIYYYKSPGNDAESISAGDWVVVGSSAWRASVPTLITNSFTSASAGTLTLNGTSVTISQGDTAQAVVDKINGLSIDGVTAKKVGNQVYVFYSSTTTSPDGDSSAEGLLAVTNSSSSLGLSGGNYPAPELVVAPHTAVPTFKIKDFTSTGTAITGRPTGSVWIKSTEPGNGARFRVKRYSSATQAWAQISAPIYASSQAALYYLDRSGGGVNLPTNALYVQSNVSETLEDVAEFNIYRRAATGPTVITSKEISEGTLTTGTKAFSLSESVLGSAALSSVVSVLTESLQSDAGDADLIAAAINAAGFTNIVASVTTVNVTTKKLVISHKLGGEIRIVDTNGIMATLFGNSSNLYTAPAASGATYVASNWSLLTDFTASPDAPLNEPADGQLWFNNNYSEVDMMVHNGKTWVGYRNFDFGGTGGEGGAGGTDVGGPIVAATMPTLQSDGNDLTEGDLWISTADMENFPTIYKFSENPLGVSNPTIKDKWVLVDKTDQISEDGVLFADARWATSGGDTNVSQTLAASSIKDLLVSNFLDTDAPDPALYPKGMLLWNLRRSGGNVKQYRNNYIDTTADNTRFDADNSPLGNVYEAGQSMGDYVTDRWTTASPNNEDGSGSFGRKAQRGVVVAAMKSVIDTSEEIRDEERRNFNLIAAPGYPEVYSNLVNLNIDRGLTAFVLADTPLRLKSNATELINWGTNARAVTDNGDSGVVTYDEYSAMWYPNGYTTDLSGVAAIVPATHMMLKTIALSDQVSYPWFAPAGTRRGGITNATSVGYIDSTSGEFQTVFLNEGMRDVLYDLKINPIPYFVGVGHIAFGQKTRARNASALDRINVARLVCYLRSQLNKLARPYLFEPNDKITRDEIKGAVESLLLELVGLRAIYDFAVQCDEQNNTPARIDRNELYVDIAIEPVKAVEFIYIPLRVKNTGEI